MLLLNYIPDDNKLLIDPSLVVCARTYNQISTELRSIDLGTVYLPAAFIDGLKEKDESLVSFYLGNASGISIAQLRRELLESEAIREYRVERVENELFFSLKSRIEKEFPNSRVSQALWEEWIFLQQESWIGARIRRTFQNFMKAGAAIIELSKEVLDKLAGPTLQLPKRKVPRPLTTRQRLQAVTKWIALGGSSASSLLSPKTAAISTFITGAFFLFDP